MKLLGHFEKLGQVVLSNVDLTVRKKPFLLLNMLTTSNCEGKSHLPEVHEIQESNETVPINVLEVEERVRMRIPGQDPPEERRAGSKDDLMGFDLLAATATAVPFFVVGAESHVEELLGGPEAGHTRTQRRREFVPSASMIHL